MAQRNDHEIFEERRSTRWKNPTNRVVRIDFYRTHTETVPSRMRPDGTKTDPHQRAVKVRVTWQPGEVQELPLEWDRAVQTVHGAEWDPEIRRHVRGAIVGGEGPMLINLSLEPEQRATLHESLDTQKQIRIAAMAQSAAALASAKTAADLAMLSQIDHDRLTQLEREAQAKLNDDSDPAKRDSAGEPPMPAAQPGGQKPKK